MNTNSQTDGISTSSNASQSPTWSLVALSPTLGDLSVPLGVSTSVGRQQDNDIVLATPQISRQHAKFNQIGSKLFVQDLGSSNGTFVNGQRIATQAVELEQADEVGFADILFVVAEETSLNQDVVINETATQQPTEAKTLPASAVVIAESAIESITTTPTEVVPLPATVITNEPVSTQTINIVEKTAEITSDIATTSSPISNQPVQPEKPEIGVIKTAVPKQLNQDDAIISTTSTPSSSVEPTIKEQTISPLTQTTSAMPTVPKNASTQTWLVAIIIIILIVCAIIGTLFLK